MLLRRLFTAILLVITTAAAAQFDTSWKVRINDSVQELKVFNFSSANEAKGIINRIVAVMNIKVNFEVRAANVPNAGAVVYNGKRYILYNPFFIQQIDNAAQTNWASVSILAHEIGHHVLGHTLRSNGNSYEQELQADEFSGIVLKKMGASLAEAQLAIQMIAGDMASASHPAKAYRLDAIEKGWDATAVNADIAAVHPTDSNTAVVKTRVASVTTVAASNAGWRNIMPDKYILADVNFSIDKNNAYFITVENTVVRWNGTELAVVAKLSPLKNAEYPFYIFDITRNYVFISKDGYLVDRNGTRIGYLSMHASGPTVAR